MNENNEIEEKNISKANIWFAVVLGLIALSVGIMPFFYMNNIAL